MNTIHKSNNLKEEIIKFSELSKSAESCAFIIHNEDTGFEIKPCKNFASDPRMFEIHPAEFLNVKTKNNLIAVFHTHVDADENFTEYDFLASKECLYPYLVYSLITKKFNFFYEENFEPEISVIKELEEVIND